MGIEGYLDSLAVHQSQKSASLRHNQNKKETKKISIFGGEEKKIFEDSKSIKNDFEDYMRVSNSKYGGNNKSIDSRNNLNLWDLSLQNNDPKKSVSDIFNTPINTHALSDKQRIQNI